MTWVGLRRERARFFCAETALRKMTTMKTLLVNGWLLRTDDMVATDGGGKRQMDTEAKSMHKLSVFEV